MFQAKSLPRFGRPCRRRLDPCRAATSLDIAHYLQQEVTIEGVLHVSAAQAGSCMQRFGDFDALPAPALPFVVDTVLASAQDSTSQDPAFKSSKGHNPAQTADGASEQVLNEAFCLATPPDNPAEGTSSPMRPVSTRTNTEDAPQVFRGAAGRLQARTNSSVLDSEAEELLQLETAAYQRMYMSAHAMYTTEALQASAAVRRQRRRVLLRLLRNGRDVTSSTLSVLQATPPAQLLASISSSISSMASWDDDTAASASCSSKGVSCRSEGVSRDCH